MSTLGDDALDVIVLQLASPEFLTRRLEAAPLFVEEAVRARAKLV